MNRWLDIANQWLQQLSPRDRRALWMGGSVVISIIVVGSLLTLHERNVATAERLQQKRALLANLPASLDRLRRIERLGADAGLPLGTLVRQLLETSGVVATVEMASDGSMAIELADASFDGTLEFIAELEAHRLTLNTARIDSGTQTGRVNARFELGARNPSSP